MSRTKSLREEAVASLVREGFTRTQSFYAGTKLHDDLNSGACQTGFVMGDLAFIPGRWVYHFEYAESARFMRHWHALAAHPTQK
jgi:hypothetical protein